MKKSDKRVKFNWPLVGNQHIIDFLSKSVINGKVSHFYIFLGPDDLGKTTLANYFAKSLLCGGRNETLPCGVCPSCRQFDNNIHGDFHLIKKDKDKKNISIEQVREFINILSLSSFLNSYKVGVIKGAEKLSREAANALLKTLEEPKDKVVLILIASSLESLPPTIASRGQVLNFYPVKKDIIHNYLVKSHKATRSQAKNLACLCLGRPALAVKLLENKDFLSDYLERVKIFLSFLNKDINGRLEDIRELIGGKAAGQESVSLAFRIIETWQGLARDLLLIKFNQANLIQHEIVSAELIKQKERFTVSRLLSAFKFLEKGKEYLNANVNPKLALESIAVGLN